MNEIDIHSVMKWVLIVLAAGFIGQFGKTFAQYVMKKTRERAARRESPAVQPVVDPPVQKPLPLETAGEGSVGRGQQTVSAGSSPSDTDGKADKKIAKAKKKEIKLLKKMFK